MDYLQALEKELDFWNRLEVDSNTEKIKYPCCFCDHFIQHGFFEQGFISKKGELFEAGNKPFCHMCVMWEKNVCGKRKKMIGKLNDCVYGRKVNVKKANKIIMRIRAILKSEHIRYVGAISEVSNK